MEGWYLNNLEENIEKIIHIFNIDSKSDLMKYCRDLIIYRKDLAELIMLVDLGCIYPYRYHKTFLRKLPDHLYPNIEERNSIINHGVGVYKTKEAQKFANKLFQLHKEQRSLVAHIFYTEDWQYWHVFYHDNKDKLIHDNHWKCGPHIHYVSYLWSGLTLSLVLEKIRNGDLNFSNKLHIRYVINS